MATTQKIRYSDCDPQGIVFNGNYARYWDDAVTDWMDEAGFGGLDLGGTGADMVAARLEIDFKSSATLGDVIETSVAVEKLGNTSMTLAITTSRQSDGNVVVSGREVVVFIDPQTFVPTPIPGPIREAFT
jgi:YbgC/YbaW family acyl-CoA thioester hydrolase